MNSSSGSIEQDFYQQGLRLVPIKATIGFLAVLLNGVVLFVFVRLKRTFSNLLFISLSLSDLLIGLVFMPLYIANTTLYYWPFGDTADLVSLATCLLYLVIEVGQWLPSVLTVLVLAAHRCQQLYSPTRASETVTRTKVLILVSVWTLPYLVNATRFIVFYNQGYVNVSICMAQIPIVQFVVYSALASILPVLASLFFNLANVVGLIRKGLKSKGRRSAGHRPVLTTAVLLNDEAAGSSRTVVNKVLRKQSSRKLRKDIKASICIGVIILSNLVTQYPFAFLWPIETLCDWCVPASYFDISFYMLLASPVVNPLLLFFFHELFQMRLLVVLRYCYHLLVKRNRV